MLDPNLLATLYNMGAEIVLTATEAKQVQYNLTFEGQSKPLTLTLPPGHYIFCRVTDAPSDQPGLVGVSNPDKGKPSV